MALAGKKGEPDEAPEERGDCRCQRGLQRGSRVSEPWRAHSTHPAPSRPPGAQTGSCEWEGSPGENYISSSDKGGIDKLAISPDVRWIATTGLDPTLRLWPHPDLSKPTLHTLPRDMGEQTSITIGADGLPLISYSGDSDLRVARCANRSCTASTFATRDSVGILGAESSIAIGSDGLGIISYVDKTNTSLKVAHCVNRQCLP